MEGCNSPSRLKQCCPVGYERCIINATAYLVGKNQQVKMLSCSVSRKKKKNVLISRLIQTTAGRVEHAVHLGKSANSARASRNVQWGSQCVVPQQFASIHSLTGIIVGRAGMFAVLFAMQEFVNKSKGRAGSRTGVNVIFFF